MKLKYYLRGLGIGIIVTAIILTIVSSVNNNEKENEMTSAQIIERAQELGMVTKDEYNTVKQDLDTAKNNIENLKEEVLNASNEESNSKEINSEDANSEASDGAETENDDTNAAETKVDDEENKSDANVENDSTSDKSKLTDPSQMVKDIKFSITAGMGSEAVARILEEKGVIVSASEFNKYLVDSGNANFLQVGDFSADEGESYDSIISKITKR